MRLIDNLLVKLKHQNIVSAAQFDKRTMETLFRRALKMEKVVEAQRNGGKSGRKGGGFLKLMDGKILATLFYEPSTRTRMSFESAFLRLGGKVVSGADMAGASSSRKGESLYDTGRVVSEFADLIVMRHPEVGSTAEVARGAKDAGEASGTGRRLKHVVPVINAGDGIGDHPTQALLDVYTMWKEFKGKLDGLVIGMVGDLKNGRVPHSQCELLKHWNVEFVFVLPRALAMPWNVKDDLTAASRKFLEMEDLGAVIGGMDVICATRIQAERFKTQKEYLKYKGVYVIDGEMMKKAKKSALLLHPLPRVDEITVDVDRDPRAKYFEQVRNGLCLRMALMAGSKVRLLIVLVRGFI